jgi:DMSO/TMAO reductase YedYZ heme-binding membrane subunit
MTTLLIDKMGASSREHVCFCLIVSVIRSVIYVRFSHMTEGRGFTSLQTLLSNLDFMACIIACYRALEVVTIAPQLCLHAEDLQHPLIGPQ